MFKLALIGGVVAFLFGLAYLFTVALVWLVLFFAGKTFAFYPGWNVWYLGALVFFVSWILKGIFKNNSK